MNNEHKKLANKKHEEEASWTSRDFGGRIGRTMQRLKRSRNRLAKRKVARDDMREQVEQ